MVDGGVVPFEIHLGDDLPQEKVGPLPLVDEARVLPPPAEAGAVGQLALEDRRGVDEVAPRRVFPGFLPDGSPQLP